MEDFKTYLDLGFHHITDPKGYDHILFIATLCAVFRVSEWKKVLLLATAFTVGHSVTLALSALDIVHFSSTLVEVLIPITILLTALYNIIFYAKRNERSKVYLNYLITLGFGLIHGMGFSTFFKAIMGSSKGIMLPLFAFNLGIELGQILIVCLLLLTLYLLTITCRIVHRDWTLFVSGAGFGLAVIMLLERIVTP